MRQKVFLQSYSILFYVSVTKPIIFEKYLWTPAQAHFQILWSQAWSNCLFCWASFANCFCMFGGDYIPVGRDEILSHFINFSWIISCDYMWKLSFSQNGISLGIFTCNRFIPPERVKKINLSLKKSIEVHFSRSKIFLLCFYDAYDVKMCYQWSFIILWKNDKHSWRLNNLSEG